MTKIITIASHKGGVGKTTSSRNIAKGLALQGKKVLLVDMDAQGSLTTSCNVRLKPDERSIAEALLEQKEVPLRRVGTNEWLIPADTRLAYAGQQLANAKDRNVRLSNILAQLNYDFIIIDSAPSFDAGCFSALRAADFIIIPTEAAMLSLQGAVKIGEAIQRVQAVKPSLEILGIVITRYERTISNREAASALEHLFPGKVFETKIRRNTALAEAPAKGMSIFEYAPESTGAAAYKALVNEILKRING